MADGPDISLRGVTKRFGALKAVDDLTLEVPRGSFFALLGPSGCGKTTTLRMIGGFEEPTEGVIELGGADVTNVPPHKRDVNTVFQSYALFPHLSVEDNIGFGLARKRTPRAQARQRVAEVIELVQLGGLARRRPAQLSGGQQQRVSVARALVNKPRALLLDEPLGALDLRLRKQLQLELSHIQQEVGITFVHVTHDQEGGDDHGGHHRRDEGRPDRPAFGGPAELYDHPRTEFVANFLGSSNLSTLSPRAPTATVPPSRWTAARRSARAPCTPSTAPCGSACDPEKLTLSPPRAHPPWHPGAMS